MIELSLYAGQLPRIPKEIKSTITTPHRTQQLATNHNIIDSHEEHKLTGYFINSRETTTYHFISQMMERITGSKF